MRIASSIGPRLPGAMPGSAQPGGAPIGGQRMGAGDGRQGVRGYGGVQPYGASQGADTSIEVDPFSK